MSAPPLRLLRRAIVSALKEDVPLLALLSEDDIHGERVPADQAWPFIKYGSADASQGYRANVPIHAFSKSEFTDEAWKLIEAIGDALDSATLALEDGSKAYCALAQLRVIPDAQESAAWHGIASISVRLERECGES